MKKDLNNLNSIEQVNMVKALPQLISKFNCPSYNAQMAVVEIDKANVKYIKDPHRDIQMYCIQGYECAKNALFINPLHEDVIEYLLSQNTGNLEFISKDQWTNEIVDNAISRTSMITSNSYAEDVITDDWITDARREMLLKRRPIMINDRRWFPVLKKEHVMLAVNNVKLSILTHFDKDVIKMVPESKLIEVVTEFPYYLDRIDLKQDDALHNAIIDKVLLKTPYNFIVFKEFKNISSKTIDRIISIGPDAIEWLPDIYITDELQVRLVKEVGVCQIIGFEHPCKEAQMYCAQQGFADMLQRSDLLPEVQVLLFLNNNDCLEQFRIRGTEPSDKLMKVVAELSDSKLKELALPTQEERE